MDHEQLRHQDGTGGSTGVPEADGALYSLVNVLSLGAGESLRAVLLVGSYANGSRTPDSDLDLCLVLKDTVSEPVRRRVASPAAHVGRTQRLVFDPMHNGTEAPLYDTARYADDSWGAGAQVDLPGLRPGDAAQRQRWARRGRQSWKS